jgi:hypothetical protein
MIHRINRLLLHVGLMVFAFTDMYNKGKYACVSVGGHNYCVSWHPKDRPGKWFYSDFYRRCGCHPKKRRFFVIGRLSFP